TGASTLRTASSTSSGAAAITIEVSYSPAWHAPLLNSASSVFAHFLVSGQATLALRSRPASTARTAASWAGSRWLLTRHTWRTPLPSRPSHTAARYAVSTAAGTET